MKNKTHKTNQAFIELVEVTLVPNMPSLHMRTLLRQLYPSAFRTKTTYLKNHQTQVNRATNNQTIYIITSRHHTLTTAATTIIIS